MDCWMSKQHVRKNWIDWWVSSFCPFLLLVVQPLLPPAHPHRQHLYGKNISFKWHPHQISNTFESEHKHWFVGIYKTWVRQNSQRCIIQFFVSQNKKLKLRANTWIIVRTLNKNNKNVAWWYLHSAKIFLPFNYIILSFTGISVFCSRLVVVCVRGKHVKQTGYANITNELIVMHHKNQNLRS